MYLAVQGSDEMNNLLRRCDACYAVAMAVTLVFGVGPSGVFAQTIDKQTRQNVIESLAEAKQIKNSDLRNRVYDAWALSLTKRGFRRIEEMQASMPASMPASKLASKASKEPGALLLRNKTRADQVRSVTRIAIALTTDMKDHFAAFNVDTDEVIAAVLSSASSDEPGAAQAKQGQRDEPKSSAVYQIVRLANTMFWDAAQSEGLLGGTDRQQQSQAYTRTVMGPRVKVNQGIRQGVIKALPEARLIKNQELRERLYDAWAFALGQTSFRRLEDIRGSGSTTSPPLKDGSQADHLRGVARFALAVAKEMSANFAQFDVDPDEVVAGGLLHDLGKAFEFDPENQKRWQANWRKTGFPAIRHPPYGAHIALSVGLPEGIAHVIGAHSGEGNLVQLSTVAILVRDGDVAFWRITEAAGLLATK